MSGPGAGAADAGGAVLYEVNLDIDAEVIATYRRWLDAHVAEICALPGFTGARVFAVIEPPAAAGRVSLCVQYTLRDAAALDAYLEMHATRMRADGLARFGGKFNANRRILRPA